jgi:hypothetical protein
MSFGCQCAKRPFLLALRQQTNNPNVNQSKRDNMFRQTKTNSAMFFISLAILTGALAGCESKDKASFSTQEQSRQSALENATYNANNWRNANAPDNKVVMRGDSSIGPDCVQGDGWATVDLVNEQNKAVTKLKCSTVSGTIGCMTEADFKPRTEYSSRDGHCNTDLPFPLPKIVR